MIHLARAAPWLVALALVGVAHAQVGRFTPIRVEPVTFTVTEADLIAARACDACVTVPSDVPAPLVYEVRRQNPNSVYVIDVTLLGWTPADGPELEARVTVTDATRTSTLLFGSDWFSVATVPTEVFDQWDAGNRARVLVTVEYRLRLVGDETAGAYATSVEHRVRGTNETLVHGAQVGLPTYVALRWVGTAADGAATVRFAYGDAPVAYLAAVASGAPLPPTSVDFDRLELETNHPAGATVVLTVTVLGTPSGAGDLLDRLRVAGAAPATWTFSVAGPTAGFVPVLVAADFVLAVDGTETPGSYGFELRYTAVRNP